VDSDLAGSCCRTIGKLDIKLLAKATGHADPHARSQSVQLRGDEDLDAVADAMLAVGGEVLALDVGVDRHLSDLASTDGLDEIDRHHPALAGEEVHGRVGDLDLHTATLPAPDGLAEYRVGLAADAQATPVKAFWAAVRPEWMHAGMPMPS